MLLATAGTCRVVVISVPMSNPDHHWAYRAGWTVAQSVLLSSWGLSKSWNLGSAALQLCLSSPGISHASTPRFKSPQVRFALRCVNLPNGSAHAAVSPSLQVWRCL